MYKGPARILSDNSKTTVSLNLPIKDHCRPTTLCVRQCYARTGNVAFPFPKRKQRWVSRYLMQPDVARLIDECRTFTAVRLSGTGDLKNGHVDQILRIVQACPTTQFWGMTRKTDIATILSNHFPNLHMMVSVDSTSPKRMWGYTGPMCWGPRMPDDVIPDDPRLKVYFPMHKAGRVLKALSPLPMDCPGVWHTVNNCLDCHKCWSYE